jgi:hypothetical protein
MSRLRFITEFSRITAKVTIFYDSENEEYICRVFREGRHYEPADYFTDCYDDAMLTARTMLEEESARIERTSKPAELGCFAPEYTDTLRAFVSPF